jgi:hypothetical protein
MYRLRFFPHLKMKFKMHNVIKCQLCFFVLVMFLYLYLLNHHFLFFVLIECFDFFRCTHLFNHYYLIFVWFSHFIHIRFLIVNGEKVIKTFEINHQLHFGIILILNLCYSDLTGYDLVIRSFCLFDRFKRLIRCFYFQRELINFLRLISFENFSFLI